MSHPAAHTATAALVGTWSEELHLESGTYVSTLHFTPNGRALILVGPRPGCVGAGTWVAAGESRFIIDIVELVFDHGSYTGWIDIHQEAVQTGDTFISTGVSHVYDMNDHLLETAQVEASATRVQLASSAD